jgi:hypothetical protein
MSTLTTSPPARDCRSRFEFRRASTVTALEDGSEVGRRGQEVAIYVAHAKRCVCALDWVGRELPSLPAPCIGPSEPLRCTRCPTAMRPLQPQNDLPSLRSARRRREICLQLPRPPRYSSGKHRCARPLFSFSLASLLPTCLPLQPNARSRWRLSLCLNARLPQSSTTARTCLLISTASMARQCRPFCRQTMTFSSSTP